MIVWISNKVRWLIIYIYPRARIPRPCSSLGIGPAITWLDAAIVPVVHCSADAILELQTDYSMNCDMVLCAHNGLIGHSCSPCPYMVSYTVVCVQT